MASHSISVVIPAYNCAEMLPNAVHSVYAQTIPAAQVIVVDDGSTDRTAEVIKELAASLPSSFTYLRKPNGGDASARNSGVSAATSEFVAFLDADDTWLPRKLEMQLPLFDTLPSPSLTFTALNWLSSNGRDLVRVEDWQPTPEGALRRLMVGCCVTPSTVLVRRDTLVKAGPFDESLSVGSDWDMWLRLAATGHHFGYLPEPMTDYLWHTNNISRDQRKTADVAITIFTRLFRSGSLPPAIQSEEYRCLARWHLNRACYRLDAGEGAKARRSLAMAARIRPMSFRLGWLLLGARSVTAARNSARKAIPSG